MSAAELDRDVLVNLAEQLAPLIAERLGPAPVEPLIDADQAAELLGLRNAKGEPLGSWVREQARQNRIPHHPIGRYVRFKASELAAWADARAKGPVRR